MLYPIQPIPKLLIALEYIMRDNSNPKLLVSKTAASEKIQDRINIGKELYQVQISSEQEYNNLRHEREKWVDYNKSLFDTLFDKSPLSDWHGYSIGFARILNHTLFQQNVEALKKDIDGGVNQLESIHEQLELYEETTQIREQLRYAKENNGIQDPNDNQIPEHHQNQNRSEFWNRRSYGIAVGGIIVAILVLCFGEGILMRPLRWVWNYLQTLL